MGSYQFHNRTSETHCKSLLPRGRGVLFVYSGCVFTERLIERIANVDIE
jgi:hypothetical protein